MMKRRIALLIPGIFLSACAVGGHSQGSGEVSDLKRQIYELQKTVGAQDRRIEELNNKILLLKDRVDNKADNVIPAEIGPPAMEAPATSKTELLPKAGLPQTGSTGTGTQIYGVVSPPVSVSKTAPTVIPAEEDPLPAKAYTGPEKLFRLAFADSKKPQVGALEKDVEAMLRSYRESPLTNNALFLLAETLYNRGQFAKSAGQFERLYKLFPDGNKAVSALYRLGLCYKKMGRNNEANEAFQNIISVYPGSREAQDSQKQLAGRSGEVGP